MIISSKASSSLITNLKPSMGSKNPIPQKICLLLGIQLASKLSKFLDSVEIEIIDIKKNEDEFEFIYPETDKPAFFLEKVGVSERAFGLIAYADSIRALKRINSLTVSEHDILNGIYKNVINVIKNSPEFSAICEYIRVHKIAISLS